MVRGDLIGGGACDVQFREKDIDFRATKDLDIILIVEVLTDEFANHFWNFVKAGEYMIAEVVGNYRTYAVCVWIVKFAGV